jgi:hypothetical protein
VVLLHLVFENAADDGTADRAEDAVVGLVSDKTTRDATSKCTSEATVAILSFTWGSLVVASFLSVMIWLESGTSVDTYLLR